MTVTTKPSGMAGMSGTSGLNKRGTGNRTTELADTLDAVRDHLTKYIGVSNDGDLSILTLWAAHTYVCMETYSSPRLQIDSAMPGSGKTTVLEHLEKLSINPVQAASLSSPALLTRMIDKGITTILIDECDRSLAPKNPSTPELLAILNSGYKRGGTRPVLEPVQGGGWEPKLMSTYSPVAMAGNAPDLPDDTRSRCIRILLMPDLNNDIEESDWEVIEEGVKDLGERLASSMDKVRDEVRVARPPLPEGCKGRIKEKWNPLRRIAEVAGGDWPDMTDELIRRDISEIQMDREDGMQTERPTLILLRDIKEIFGDKSFLASEVLIEKLAEYNPEMWGPECRFGKAITQQRMGKMLVQGWKINSYRQTSGDRLRGYLKSSFEQPWRRMKMIDPTSTGTPPNQTGRTGQAGLTGPILCRTCRTELHPSNTDGIHPTCDEPLADLA